MIGRPNCNWLRIAQGANTMAAPKANAKSPASARRRRHAWRQRGGHQPEQQLRPAEHAQGQGGAGQRRPRGTTPGTGGVRRRVCRPRRGLVGGQVSASRPTTASSAAGVSVITCVDWAKRMGSTATSKPATAAARSASPHRRPRTYTSHTVARPRARCKTPMANRASWPHSRQGVSSSG